MSPERYQQIMNLFDEASERPSVERVALFDQRCHADDELRHEVEKMFAAQEKCAPDFLQESAWELEARQLALADRPLSAGETLAQFTILAPLGAGAMGEVYLARDLRLDRKIALKVLPTHFTRDASRLRRFEREARSASALNHQNIITIYDFGQAETTDGTRYFMAAEYVEGVTLRTRLQEGALPFAEARDIALQIAAALEAAHAAGIIHRDIKPENIMLRPDGVVKVLDFGIAKLTEASKSGTAPLLRSTEQGTVIGTPGYMSPEQARGLDIDVRTDVFSLGVVLYEMLTGQQPFQGSSQADVTLSLLDREPPPLAVFLSSEALALQPLINKAIAKDRTHRYAAIKQFADELTMLDSSKAVSEVKAKEKSRKHRRLGKVLLAGLVIVFLAGLGWWSRGPYQRWRERSAWGMRGNLNTSEVFSTRVGYRGEFGNPTISPDGRRIAYSLSNDGRSQIYVRNINGEAETRLTDGPWFDQHPIWSHDGTRLAFLSTRDGAGARAIWLMPAIGGEPARLHTTKDENLKVIAWRKNGTREQIYYEEERKLFAFELGAGTPQLLTRWASKGTTRPHFALSPDQQFVAYVENENQQNNLKILSLQDGQTTLLVSDVNNSTRSAWFPTGDKIAFLAERDGALNVYLVWLSDRLVEQVTFDNQLYDSLQITPDGRTILMKSVRDQANIFSLELSRQIETQHTSEFGLQVLPEFSPDHRHMTFQAASSVIQGKESILLQNLASGVAAEKLTTLGFNARWSPQGNTISFLRQVTGRFDLWLFDLNTRTEKLLQPDVVFGGILPSPYYLQYPDVAWSPDGNSLVYPAKRAGFRNLWQAATDGSWNKQLTNFASASTTVFSPVWSVNGKQLAYLMTEREKPEAPLAYRLRVKQDEATQTLYESPRPLRISGWLATDSEILLVETLSTFREPLQDVALIRVRRDQRRHLELARFPRVYFNSFKLSHDGKQLAFVTRANGRDNLTVFHLHTGVSKQVTDNREAMVLLSSLNWSPDDRHLYFSKQTQWQFVTRLEKKN